MKIEQRHRDLAMSLAILPPSTLRDLSEDQQRLWVERATDLIASSESDEIKRLRAYEKSIASYTIASSNLYKSTYFRAYSKSREERADWLRDINPSHPEASPPWKPYLAVVNGKIIGDTE